jgi:phage baseplate assembly protein W
MATTSTTTSLFGSAPNKATARKVSSQAALPTGILYPLAKYQDKRVISPISKTTSVEYFVKSSGKELVTGMLRQLLLTRPGERVMLPSYGLNLDNYLFEPLDITTFSMMKEDILSTIADHAGFLEVLKLSIFESPPWKAQQALTIYLNVKIRDNNLIPPFEVGLSLS